MMEILLAGTSHRTSPVRARECVAVTAGDPRDWLRRCVGRSPAIAEALVLSTCHRFEVYAAVTDIGAARTALETAIAPADAGGGWYHRDGLPVVRHLARVACGLDSLIVGEAEVAGQVRRAAAVAREAGTLGPYLEAVVAGALAASGRARCETGIGRGVMSAASASIALASGLLGSLADRTVVVVGAGQMGRLALARAARAPHGRLVVVSRSERHAREAAADTGAEVRAAGDLPATLADADVVVAAVQHSGWLVTASQVAKLMAQRADRPLLLIDLSVPRVIEPATATMPGVLVRSVDDLGDIARRSAEARVREVPLVDAIAVDEARHAYRRVVARRAHAMMTRGRA
jgi:glutamyl-tRNA reductase